MCFRGGDKRVSDAFPRVSARFLCPLLRTLSNNGTGDVRLPVILTLAWDQVVSFAARGGGRY